MTREVERHVTKDADGNRIVTKSVHIDRPRKTIDKEIVREKNAETGEVSRSRSRTVKKK